MCGSAHACWMFFPECRGPSVSSQSDKYSSVCVCVMFIGMRGLPGERPSIEADSRPSCCSHTDTDRRPPTERVHWPVSVDSLVCLFPAISPNLHRVCVCVCVP